MVRTTEKNLAVLFGGSGFIGQHLARRLVALGYDVVIADLTPIDLPGAEFHFCDVRQEIDLRLARKPTVIYNLAAVHRTPGHKSEEYYDTNVLGAINIVKWVSKVEVRKIVFTSSISVYGLTKESKIETNQPSPIHPYGKSKYMAENIFNLWLADNRNQRALVICRPAVIFGQGENGNFTRLATALKRHVFFYPEKKSIVKACGYVHDLVESFVFVSNRAERGLVLYNFAFPFPYTIGNICEAFARVANYSLPHRLPLSTAAKFLLRMPGFAHKLGARLMKLSNSTDVQPLALMDMGFVWKFDLISALQHWRSESRTSEFK
jgi:nucleoside-diphosphate-sugar epimerase